MIIQRRAAALAPAVALLLAACSAAPELRDPAEGARATTSPIIKGTDSTAAQDAVVLLIIEVGNQGAGCTGTLLAPNLVLTARHCVSAMDEAGHACDGNGNTLAGNTTFGADFAPSKIHVMPGVSMASMEDIFRAPVGKKIIHGTETSVCRGDVALILLDRPIDDPKIAPIRLDQRPTVNEALTAVGWGVFSSTGTPNTRQTRAGVRVLRLGPQLDTQQSRAVPPRFFEVGESICQGDSGGPGLASSGAVVGVVSQGGNGRDSQTDPSVGCIGTSTRNLYADVTSSKDVILGAYREAGQAAWLEGQPSPRAGLAAFGEACTSDADCDSSVCLTDAKTCSKGCFNRGTCPVGVVCAEVGQRDLCVTAKKPQPKPGETPESPAEGDEVTPEEGGSPSAKPAPPGVTTTTTTTGCALATGTPSSPTSQSAAAGLLAFALFAARRRRRG